MRVAIVGQGPRGIQALFALAEQVQIHPRGAVALDVECFDPQPPGHGSAYAVDQPDCLRLNVRPDIVDLPGCPRFTEWLSAHGLTYLDVPRSHVGRYFKEMRAALLENLPDGMRVVTHRASVQDLAWRPAGWELSAHEQVCDLPFDEVLLTIGHAAKDVSPLSALRAIEGKRVIGEVYPMHEQLTVGRVPPESRVLVRGAALTFIDVALVLGSERLMDQRPRAVIPTSRSGLLMNTKPLARIETAAEEVLTSAAAMLIEQGPSGVLNAPRALAARLIEAIHGLDMQNGVQQIIARLLDKPPRPASDTADHLTARERLAHSIALAENASANVPLEAEVEWALGRAWALLYPQIVEAASWFDEASGRDWDEFRRQSSRYERLTFGPTLPQARRLLALCDSGFVDTSWLDRRQTLEDVSPLAAESFDVIIDAVLAPPGVMHNDRPLIRTLMMSGHLTPAADGRRGLLINDDARCLDVAGQPIPGLSLIGRASEDVVIGHDTLNRHAHPHLMRWAQRIGDQL